MAPRGRTYRSGDASVGTGLWPALTARLGRRHLLGACKVDGEALPRPRQRVCALSDSSCGAPFAQGPRFLTSFLLDVAA